MNKKVFSKFKMFLFLILFTNTYLFSQEENLLFTELELQWIKEHPVIRVANEENWQPFDYVENNQAKGFSIDYMNLLAQKIGIKVKHINGYTWAELIELFKDKKIDVMPVFFKNEERMNYTLFTQAYHPGRIGLFMNKRIIHIIEEDTEFTAAMLAGSGSIPLLKRKYPKVEIVTKDKIIDLLKDLEDMKVDVVVGSPPHAISYMAQKYNFDDTVLENYVELTEEEQKDNSFHIGVRNDWEILHTIIQKAMTQVTNSELLELEKKWYYSSQKKVDYTLLWQILAVIVTVLLIFIYRHILLYKHNKKLKETEKKLSDLTLQLEDKVKEEVKKNEEKTHHLIQQSKLAQTGEMISMIAHQWRQPLTAISATANGISLQVQIHDNITNEELLKEISLISQYSDHLSSTIDDFRDFYKPKKEKEITSLEGIIEKTISIIDSSYREKNIKVIRDYKCVQQIYTYPSHLSQVLLNILKNAEDILIEKQISKPEVKISTYIEDDCYILEVLDNAGGITNENLNKVFEPYFSTKMAKDGTGLGLYMSKTIVEEHCKGTLEAKNIENGALFKISIKKQYLQKDDKN